MATIRKRSWTTTKGEQRETWVVRYADADGKWRLKSFERQGDAKAWRTTMLGEVRDRTHRPDSAAPTVTAACAAWLRRGEADGLERSTMAQRRQHVELHILPLLGRTAKLSKIDVEALRDELLTTRSRPMAAKIMTSLRSILKQHKLLHLAADAAPVRTGGRHKRRLEVGRDIPSPAEVNTLLAAAGGRVAPLLAVMVFCGLRMSEARGLRWCDVDLPGRVVHVRQRADKWCALGAPKSDTSKRAIPLFPLVLGRLREWKLACPRGDLDLVFPTRDGTVQSLPNIWNRLLAPLQVRAGLVGSDVKPKYGAHAFRHFFASWLLEQGFNVKRVSVLLGHSSPVVTLNVYAHLLPDEDEHAKLAEAERKLLATQTAQIHDMRG
jgi:integrase